MEPHLKLQIRNKTNFLAKKYTKSELVELLSKSGLNVKGVLENCSKQSFLKRNLRSADESSLKEFFRLSEDSETLEIGSKPGKKLEDKVDLHRNFVGTKVEKFLEAEEYFEAVRVAFLRINNRVKKITGLHLDGAVLMRSTFSPKKPIIALNNLISNEEKDEQEGVMEIFVGCMLAFRNPPSHNDEKDMSKREAFLVIYIANYLMTVLDKYEQLS